MGHHPIAIELRQSGNHARGASKLPHVCGRQQQPQIAGAAELVDLHQPRAQVGALGEILALELVDPVSGRGELGGDFGGGGAGPAKLLSLDLPLDLERAEIVQERALLGRQLVGLALQRLLPLGGAPGERFGAGAVRWLAVRNRRGQHNDRQVFAELATG